jgi:probable rRNA maturation factor
VTDGAAILKKYNLPKEIIHIAEQHHGNTLLKFFYHKAVQGEEEVKEEDYRYPGPKAQTKESAIVGIADSVEAAVRSLNQPTPETIESLVKKIVSDRLQDGQLNECDLTLKELETVSHSFCETLKGISRNDEEGGSSMNKLMIDLVDETNQLSEEQMEQIENLLNFAAGMENVEDNSEVSVTFVSNERIHEINREFRDKDAPTDVISFAMEELGEGEIQLIGDLLPRVLGDIIISIPKAEEQAKEYGHSFIRELGFLSVHGFLHLLGYDHMEKEEEEKMFSRQKEILDDYGLTR